MYPPSLSLHPSRTPAVLLLFLTLLCLFSCLSLRFVSLSLLQRLAGVSSKRVEDELATEVGDELHKLRAQLVDATNKEQEMAHLRHAYKSHYRSRYSHLKPLDPKSVLGDHWDVMPQVLDDINYVIPETEQEVRSVKTRDTKPLLPSSLVH